MSVPPDPAPAGTPPVTSLPPAGQNSSTPNGEPSLVDQHPELVAVGGFAGGLALALILKRLGS